jgi:hypothetical protein
MKITKLSKFAKDVLNTPELRGALKQKIEQIGRLESLDDLKDLRILGISYVEDDLFSVEYGAIASPGLYPNIVENLVDRKVINRGNIIREYYENQGKPDEYEEVKMRVPGTNSLIQVSLRVYNPYYSF